MFLSDELIIDALWTLDEHKNVSSSNTYAVIFLAPKNFSQKKILQKFLNLGAFQFFDSKE